MSDTQREAFEKWAMFEGFSVIQDGQGNYECHACNDCWEAVQAVLAQRPRISESELAKMIVELANLGEKPENHVGLALGYKVARAILTKFPQIKEGV